jgi:hypothetical protein
MGYYNSFVVKIWTEDGQNLARGYIQHVGTQESTYFADWKKMANFMLSHLSWHINGDIGDETKRPLADLRGGESSPWEQL